MNNNLTPHQEYAFTTILSITLLFFLPLLYSFHYIAATTAPIESTQQALSQDQDSVAVSLELFKFNPNTISAKDLNRLGLPQRVVKTILMFKSKGGTFRKVEDLNKIYGMTDVAFKKLKPYVQLP